MWILNSGPNEKGDRGIYFGFEADAGQDELSGFMKPSPMISSARLTRLVEALDKGSLMTN